MKLPRDELAKSLASHEIIGLLFKELKPPIELKTCEILNEFLKLCINSDQADKSYEIICKDEVQIERALCRLKMIALKSHKSGSNKPSSPHETELIYALKKPTINKNPFQGKTKSLVRLSLTQPGLLKHRC